MNVFENVFISESNSGPCRPQYTWGGQRVTVKAWRLEEWLKHDEWWNVGVFLQRSSFWTTAYSLNGVSKDWGKMLGKYLDCSPGSDISPRFTPVVLWTDGLEREWKREKKRERGGWEREGRFWIKDLYSARYQCGAGVGVSGEYLTSGKKQHTCYRLFTLWHDLKCGPYSPWSLLEYRF